MAIRFDRLLKVVRALREAPNPKRFTMRNVAHSCGTPACAIGHYAARRDLQHTFSISKVDPLWGLRITGSDRDGDWADEAAAHFGINQYQVSELFSGDGCGDARTPIAAARYIERFVKRHQKAAR